ncbi:two-component regulator propeller domain-containing protein [Vreelandella titanicae]|uniref:sensor histidine kinase n=1 Tax=Vreelandella titanicae TaxID=664683 RepID=UPI0039BFE91F
MRTYVILLLSLVLGCLACSSAVARISNDMDHRRWTASDRGPTAVGALAQTVDGYLWLGTHDSLYRFDGFEFEKFEPADGEPLGVVSALASTAEGLWVGFRIGGARLISADGVMQPVDPGLPDGVVYSFAEDQQGRVWVAADEGLAHHDGTGWRPIGKEMGFTSRHARAVHVDEDGYIWAASEEELYMLPPGASSFIGTGIRSPSISEIASSPSGDVWVTDRSTERLLHLTKTGFAGVEFEEIPISSTNSIVLDEQGDAWLGTRGSGLHYLATGKIHEATEGRDVISSYTARDGLSSDYVLAQLIDRDGNLWVGTDAGLDRLKRKDLAPLALSTGVGSTALAVDGDGSLWVGSDSGQLKGFTNAIDSTFELDMPINSLVNSQQHGLLIGGHQGVFSLSDDELVRVAALPVESTPESAVRTMAVGQNGDIWVSVNREGLFVWADQQWQPIDPFSDSERQVMPVSASRDPLGKLWFGYRDNLLVSFAEQTFERWSYEEGLDIGHVTAMLHLPGRTWVGGQHGLAYLKDGRFHRLDVPAAGSFQNIYALIAVPAEKNAGESGMDIWVHSRSGIFKLPAAEIDRVIAGGETLFYSSYDHIGRLPMDPHKVLPLPTGVSTPEGSLWFATGQGVVRVDPHKPSDMTHPPVITIQALIADGVDVGISAAPVRLSAPPQRLVINYSALNLTAPESMRFQYRLRGHDSEWVDAGRSRKAVFSRLRPGDYEFHVRVLDESGQFYRPKEALVFSVPRSFYLRPWFLLLSSGALLALVFWVSRVYTQREKAVLRTRLEERFHERERIARELHDTLLQSVQGMMLSFQAVTDSLPKESHARHAMERALDRADQVMAEGRDRITGLRGEISPAEDLAVAFQLLQQEADASVSVAYRVSNVGQPMPLRNEVRDVFYQVGREAVFNALRHAEATQISVTFTYAKDRFEMLVADDGVGMDPRYQRMRGRPGHGGLRGIYELAERIEATLMIVSSEQSGTRIRLSLPGTIAYEKPIDDKQNRSIRTG